MGRFHMQRTPEGIYVDELVRHEYMYYLDGRYGEEMWARMISMTMVG